MTGDRHYEDAVVHFSPDYEAREEPYVGGIYLMPNGWVDLIDDEQLVPVGNVDAIDYDTSPGVKDKLRSV